MNTEGTSTTAGRPAPTFSGMPSEVRLVIYRHLFEPILRINRLNDLTNNILRDGTPQHLEIVEVDRTTYDEAMPIAYRSLFALFSKHLLDSGFLDSPLACHAREVFIDAFDFPMCAWGRDDREHFGEPLGWLERCSNLNECFLIISDVEAKRIDRLDSPDTAQRLQRGLEKAQHTLSQREKPLPFHVTLVFPAVRASRPSNGEGWAIRQHVFVARYQTDVAGTTSEELGALVARLIEEQNGEDKFSRHLARQPPWVAAVMRLRDRGNILDQNLAAVYRMPEGDL
jgi:hypothetical protein